MATLPSPVIRRAISVPLVLLAAVLSALLTPVVVPLLYLLDLLRGAPRGRWSRVWLLALGAAWIESAGLVLLSALAVAYVGRRRSPGWMAANYRVQHWWLRSHLANIALFANIGVVFDNLDVLAGGNVIMVCRHASHVDALVPARAIELSGNRTRYTLKQDLQALPAMDIVGNRTPNVWIDRAPEPGTQMFEQVRELGRGIGPGEAAVIFPESTFFTPQRLARALDRFAGSHPDLADRARGLRRMLPPRPAGTLALLGAAPGADVVVVANAGLEHGGSLSEIVARIPERVTITVRMWRHRRADLPADEDGLTAWLLDRWIEMDRWIDEQTRAAA